MIDEETNMLTIIVSFMHPHPSNLNYSLLY